MERNERLKAADRCASRYTNDNEARIARKAFMLGCEFEAQGEVVKGVVLDTLEAQEPEVDFEQELYNRFGQVKDFTLGMRIAQCFYNLGKNAK